jgi:hypothetical protein
LKKVDSKASEPPSGIATREIKGAEKHSPAFELAQARADSRDQSNRLPPVHPVLSLQRSIGNRAVGHLLAVRSAPAIQRQCATCTNDEEVVQRESPSSAPIKRSAAEIVPRNSHGEPLDNPTRDFMESRLNADLNSIRVHHDAPAGAAAENINANAFTTGHDIYFAPGKYAPNQSEGKRLLAHELAHTVQQTQGLGPTKLARKVAGVSIGHPDDPLEQQADSAADRALALSTPCSAIPATSRTSRPTARRLWS